MLKSSYEESEQLRINCGVDIDINSLNSKNDTEIVYKPTTMTNEGNYKQKFQSLKPENGEVVSKDSVYLYQTAFIANLLGFGAGVGFSWTSPVFPKLQGPDSPLGAPIDASQESKIAAILCVGAAIGPFLFGYLADKIGRKKTLLCIALPMFISLSILAFATEVKMYYFARLIYGVGSGGVFTVLTMYIGEITENHNRGKFCCIMGIFIALGLLYPFAIGPMLAIRTFCLSSLLPLLVFFMFFSIYCPESPSYSLKKDEYDTTTETLMNLRHKNREGVQAELKELQVIVETQKREKGGVAELFRTKSTYKAFVVSALLLIVQQCSGINAVTGFMENIFLASGSAIPPNIATTIIGVIQVFSVIVTASLIDKLGRKFLLIISAVGCAVSLTCLGFYFFLRNHLFNDMVAYVWWLPVFSLILYIVSFNIGLGPVPWTLVSEIFPNNVKASASALASSTNFAVSFVVTLAFPIVSEILGMAGSFWIFAVCCMFGIAFISYFLPETKGKSVTEIQQLFIK